MLYECSVKNESQKIYGDDLANSDGEHKIEHATLKAVGVSQHKGNNKRVGKDRRKRSEPFVFSESVCSDSADKRGKSAENNVLPESGAYQIGHETPDGKPGDSRGSEHGEYAKCLGKPYLNYVRGETEH